MLVREWATQPRLAERRDSKKAFRLMAIFQVVLRIVTFLVITYLSLFSGLLFCL